jgi:hypothetical protein
MNRPTVLVPYRQKTGGAFALLFAGTLAVLALCSRPRLLPAGEQPVVTSSLPEPQAQPPSSVKDAAIKSQVWRMISGNFETSIEMKEDADFLLTPAFLVQEAIDEKSLITYPLDR